MAVKLWLLQSMRPQCNPINIAKDVLEMLPELQKNMPSNIKMNVLL